MDLLQTYAGLLAIIALVLCFTNLCLLIVLFLRPKGHSEDELKDIIADSLSKGRCGDVVSLRVKTEINKINESHRKKQDEEKSLNNTKQEQSELCSSDEEAAPVMEDKKPDNQEPRSKPTALYVGTYRGGSFKNISPSPDDKTVYTILLETADATEGVIRIDVNAYDKVAATPEYLEDACNLNGNGSNVKELEAGTVIKVNNQWFVKDKITVELI